MNEEIQKSCENVSTSTVSLSMHQLMQRRDMLCKHFRFRYACRMTLCHVGLPQYSVTDLKSRQAELFTSHLYVHSETTGTFESSGALL